MSVILEMKNIEKSFPGVKALKDINLTLNNGEILAILGENGAGKSTLMKVLTGVYKVDKGNIIVFGKEEKFQNYKDAQKKGISIIFQELSLIPYFNAWENIFLGNELLKLKKFLDIKKMKEIALELMEILGVKLDIDIPVEQLSIAEQQFVEIAKAISIDVKILILDEPTSTLTPMEVNKLFDVMRELKSHGVGMIFISHHLDELFKIADNVLVIRDGISIEQNPIKDITVEKLVEQVCGRSLGLKFPPKRNFNDNKENVLSIKNLMLNNKSKPINFDLKKGEILGIFGLVGSGRTEIMRSIIGADSKYKAEIYKNGKKINIKEPFDAYRYGIGLLPEDRKTQGLILPFSVEDNISLNNIKKEIINSKEIKINSKFQVSKLSIKTPDIETPVINLSGGNQQKVIISRWLSANCDILIFDEPTRGIDIGAKDEIYKIMNELVEEGKSIIMISSELEEILGLSDRIIVIRQNEIQAELSGDASEKEVMTYAGGGHL